MRPPAFGGANFVIYVVANDDTYAPNLNRFAQVEPEHLKL